MAGGDEEVWWDLFSQNKICVNLCLIDLAV